MQSSTATSSQTYVREAAQVLLGILLLVACSQIVIPLEPVPVTLQTVAVMLIGLTFPKRAALAAVAAYLMLALAGVPVLSGWSGGWIKVTGSTAGYLLGFFVAVYAMGLFRRYVSSTSFVATFANCMLGTAVVFALGVGWLTWLYGFESAIAFGLVPFIIPGAIKAALLCGALKIVR